MAKRGRKPKSPELRVLDGTARKPQDSSRAKTLGMVGDPDKPDTVVDDPVASKSWDYAVGILRGEGRLCQSYSSILMCYSLAYSTLVRAVKEKAMAESLVAKTVEGEGFKVAPLTRIARDAAIDLARFSRDLGFTPDSMAKAGVVLPSRSKDEFEEFIKGS